MKLYSAALSLFSKKVEIALGEKGLAFERVLVPFNQRQGYAPKHPDVVAANPKGQIPVLIDGDLTLYDSTVICEYLEDAYPDPPLYPPTPAGRARCRLFEVYADDVMLTPLRLLMHRTGPRPAEQARWLELEDRARAAEETLAGHFRQIDAWLAGEPYLCGAFGVADIAMFMAVLYARRLGGPGLRATPNLAGWYDRLGARPAFAKVAADIRQADAELSAPVEGAYRD